MCICIKFVKHCGFASIPENKKIENLNIFKMNRISLMQLNAVL